ncbi:YIP1 family protein [Bacteroides sp. OttesenSCG-928-F21]|nr:YIP1 family protein [Bacteroides sp. OttesenSCG-928-F21]
MNYQEIFKIALLLISSPAKAWEEIRMQEDKQKVSTAFVYPMIGLCALSVFLGSLFTHGWDGPEAFQIAMTQCCVTAASLFGGYFLSGYIINEVGGRMFGLSSDMPLALQFAGYALVVTFFTNIITGLFPAFVLIAILLQFYIVYVVWEGVPVLMPEIKEEVRLKYTIINSAVLIVIPVVIQLLFNRLLYILN